MGELRKHMARDVVAFLAVRMAREDGRLAIGRDVEIYEDYRELLRRALAVAMGRAGERSARLGRPVDLAELGF